MWRLTPRKSLNAYNAEIKTEQALLSRLREADIPLEQNEVARIAQEIGNWRGESVTLPTPQGAADDQSAINDLLKQQNEGLMRSMSLMNQQLMAFSSFSGLVGARLLGAFAHGGVIDEPGMALVHKHERMTVDADPEGPFGSQIRSGGMSIGSIPLELHLHGGLSDVVDRAVVRHGARQTTRTSEELGRRSRLFTIAPGGR